MLAECIQERRFFKPCIWSPFAKLLCGNSTLAHETLSLIPFFRLSKMYCTPTKVPKGQPTFFFCFRRSPRSVKKTDMGFVHRMSALILIYFLRLSMKQAAAETASAAHQSRTGLSSPVFGGSFFHSAVSVISPVTVIVSPAWYIFSPSFQPTKV